MVNKEEIGKRINGLRTKASVTQEVFAKSVGITRSALSQLENGQIAPSLELLTNIVKQYGTSLDYLVSGTESNAQVNAQVNTQVTQKNDQIDVQNHVQNYVQNQQDKLIIFEEPGHDYSKKEILEVLKENQRLKEELRLLKAQNEALYKAFRELGTGSTGSSESTKIA